MGKNINNNNNKKKKKKEHPKYFLRRLAAFFIIITSIWYFNNYSIKIVKKEIYSDKIVSPLKIAIMSDYHAEKYLSKKSSSIIKKLDKINPDLVFYLGDMYSRNSKEDEIELAEKLMIDTVKAGYDVFFVPGDHDRSVNYLNVLMQNGVNVMNYQTMQLNIKGNDIQIYGINNAYFSNSFNLSKEFSIDSSKYNILMAHIPMYKYYDDFGADLTVCGDTHGGIIQIPFGKGPVYYSLTDEWFPEIKNQRNDIYDKGLFSMSGENKYMFVTSGIGNYPVHLRFNNRPEIVVIDILPD
ncbi:MAG: metallophosphoesterase [Oscillospiraceae bacterium]|nr:metallophosphoesterase [Oscillospiraceae bacterium]